MDTIEDITFIEMKDLKDAFESVAETFTTAAVSQETTNFPFVTVPFFEVTGRHAREQSGVEMFAFAPLVSSDQLQPWGFYSKASQGWIQESRNISAAQSGPESDIFENYEDTSVPGYIFEIDESGESVRSPGPGPYAPVWQMSPPVFNPERFINYNLLSEPFLDRMIHSVFLARGERNGVLVRFYTHVHNMVSHCFISIS